MNEQPNFIPPVEDDEEEVVILHARFDIDGVPIVYTTLSPASDKRIKEIHCDRRRPIPVIFLPGVMGSTLVNRTTGEALWDAPNDDTFFAYIGALVTVIGGWFRSAKARAERFDPVAAVADPRGPLIDIDEEKLGFDAGEARRRGWGSVHRSSYQSTLEWLEITLNNPMCYGVLQGEWVQGSEDGEKAALKAVLGTHPSEYGGYGEGETLTPDSEAFKTFRSYRYPVYAIGYNFLQSNELSGKDVLDGVAFEDQETKEKIRVMGIREICRENRTDKAILITHSMGGLVARMASELCGGADDILGVVHGVQPATGAPVFAKRFRTGAEGNGFLDRLINQFLMGRNAAEFVAIASYAQGPMELAPTPDYLDGKPWWIVVDAKGRERLRFPETNALEDLYISDKWYSLLPDPGLLDPAGVVRKYLGDQNIEISVHEYYKEIMRSVATRHQLITDRYHSNTYSLFGDGAIDSSSNDSNKDKKYEVSKPSSELLTFGKIIWQGNIPEGVTDEQLKAAELHSDNGKGEIKINVAGRCVTLTVQNETRPLNTYKDRLKDNGVSAGDGTVPAWSAEAQGRGLIPGVPGTPAKGVQIAFKQKGYNHQDSCKHPWTRWATLYSVAQAVYRTKKKVC